MRFACISERRRSRWRYLSRSSSAGSSSPFPRATGIAGVTAGPPPPHLFGGGPPPPGPPPRVPHVPPGRAAPPPPFSPPPPPPPPRAPPAPGSLPHQPGDAAQGLDVRSGGGLGPGQQKEQAHRLTVDRLVGYRRRGCPCDDHQGRQRRRLAVGHGHTVPDPGRELALALEDGPQHFVRESTVAYHLHQLPEHPLLVCGFEGYPDASGRQQLRQAHGRPSVLNA